MLGHKSTEMSIIVNRRFQFIERSPLEDQTQYQRLVGKLIYLSHTRHDIPYAIGIVSRFMHKPQIYHTRAVNRILRP